MWVLKTRQIWTNAGRQSSAVLAIKKILTGWQKKIAAGAKLNRFPHSRRSALPPAIVLIFFLRLIIANKHLSLSLQVLKTSFTTQEGVGGVGMGWIRWNLHSSTLLCTHPVNSLRIGLCGNDCQWLNERLCQAGGLDNICDYSAAVLLCLQSARRRTGSALGIYLQIWFHLTPGFLFLWLWLPKLEQIYLSWGPELRMKQNPVSIPECLGICLKLWQQIWPKQVLKWFGECVSCFFVDVIFKKNTPQRHFSIKLKHLLRLLLWLIKSVFF